MPKQTEFITKTRAMAEIKRLVAENPERVNPVDEIGSCLYHRGRGRNITRCIVGQMGFDLGLPTPDADYGDVWDVTSSGGPWEGLFTDAAVRYLLNVQTEADRDPKNYDVYGFHEPRPWGEIPKNVINGRA